jgi:hypothetical protein
VDETSQFNPSLSAAAPQAAASGERQPDALYQKGRLVARVRDVEIDQDAREIHFGEIINSDELLIPEECEYQKYRIQIQRIAYASKLDPHEPQKGRVLREVSADLLGYREQ